MVDKIINLKVGDAVNKKALIPAIVLGLAISAGAGWAATKAANGLGNGNMAQTLSEKLGLEESQVSTALDSIREEHQAERQQQISRNLDQAVTDGAITTEQKDALQKKQTEIQQDRQQKRAEMQQWMEDNGIDQTKLRQYLGKGMGNGGMRHGNIQE